MVRPTFDDMRQKLKAMRNAKPVDGGLSFEAAVQEVSVQQGLNGVVSSTRAFLFMYGIALSLLLVPSFTFAASIDLEGATWVRHAKNTFGIWSDMHDAAVADMTDIDGDLRAGAYWDDVSDGTIFRTAVCFDSGDIPVGATIDSVVFKGYVTNISYTGFDILALAAFSPISPSSLVAADYEDPTYYLSGEDDLFSYQSFDFIVDDAVNEMELDGNGVAYTQAEYESGYVCLALREGHDYGNDGVGSFDNSVVFDSPSGGTEPLLSIEYTPASSSSSPSSSSEPFVSPVDCVFASGCLLGSSGSILITEGVCDAYDVVSSGSGVSRVCSHWSTRVKIPFIKFAVDLVQQSGFNAVLFAWVVYCLYKISYYFIRFIVGLLSF